MHACTIAATLALAGSSMAAVLQNPPPTSTTTVYNTEIRSYGPTCAGVGPAAHTPPVDENFDPFTTEDLKELDDLEDLDVDHDGDFDHQDMQKLREMDNHELPDHVEPPTVRVGTPTCPKCPKCTKCPHPSEHNPNWNKLALLNDTRKNINAFKLFAEPKALLPALPPRFAVHVRQHEGRKDIWDIKLFPEVMEEMVQELEDLADMKFTEYKKKIATPSEKAFFQEMEALNGHQPRWNLADNRLETRSNNSAPVNDTLYFRLFENKDVKDTSDFQGPSYRSMLTTNPNKNRYNKEHNAKLVAKKSWQLKRDADTPWYYTLINKDIPGNFFWCLDQGRLAAIEAKANSMEPSGQEDNRHAVIQALKELGDHQGAELRFMNSNQTEVQLGKGGTTCMAVTLKAEQWLK